MKLFACILSVCKEPAKVSYEGTQLEVARGKKFCKAVCQIKNADFVTTDQPGAGNGQLKIFYRRAICVLQRRSFLWAVRSSQIVCASLIAAILISLTPIFAQRSEPASNVTEGCRSDGTSQYTSTAYAQLDDMLAYDRGRGFMSIHVMTTKVSQLVQAVEFNSLKILLRACAPQFVERSLGDVLLPKKNIWNGKLTRSEVILYDDGQQFLPNVIVLLTGLP